MTHIFLLSFLLQVLSPEISWQVRAGIARGGSIVSFEDNTSGLVYLTASLVASGNVSEAEKYWNNPFDPPATRFDLLSALAWNGRYQIVAAGNTQQVPPDMTGRTISDKCASICALGWMEVREDGLFHGEELVTRGDIVVLSRFFADIDTGVSFLFLSELDRLIP